MKIIADGKTKRLYSLEGNRVAIQFKDDVTGTEEGVDPGGNVVVGREEGKGLLTFNQSVYFFHLLTRHGVPNHYVDHDAARGWLIADQATWFGLEWIVRYRAFGSFLRRYGQYARQGMDLGGLVEITLKDDERGDPLIVDEAVAALGIMSLERVAEAKSLVKRAADVIREHLAEKGLDLVDIKFECGLVNDRLIIIDDVSTDNMRVMRKDEPVSADTLLHMITGQEGAGT